MKNRDINIRDPFVLVENDMYYLIGTRGADFGQKTGGFDVYKGNDLENWSDPVQVFFSEKYELNRSANWAPEIHKYNGRYYIFATFEQKNGNRGTYSLVSDTPDGEYILCSERALTPENWWSLDGTLYVSPEGEPYLVFCHEHVQILNGTICYVKLNDTLSEAIGEPVVLFKGSDASGARCNAGRRYVTDGPFLYRGINDRLYMIWSTVIKGQYYQCIALSDNGDIDGNWIQLEPVFTEDGGHGMVFRDIEGCLRLTLHCPNCSLCERPVFFKLRDTGETLVIE